MSSFGMAKRSVRTFVFTAGAIGLAHATGQQSPAYAADPIQLSLPLVCEPHKTCFIQNYFDDEQGSGVHDYACGGASYDAHDGTDFRLISAEVTKANVAVLASADGVVKGLRDGVPDIFKRDNNAAAIKGRECGNGVVIDHGEGWETQYCHMKMGTVVVVSGQSVKRGDRLGSVGFSGQADFAHVHITVRHNGRAVDPFWSNAPGPDAKQMAPELSSSRRRPGPTPSSQIGNDTGQNDTEPSRPNTSQDADGRGAHNEVVVGPGMRRDDAGELEPNIRSGQLGPGVCHREGETETLWQPSVAASFPYRRGEIIGSGFSAQPLDLKILEHDHTAVTAPNGSSPVMFFYGRFINLIAGDRVRFTVTGPGGSLIENLAEPLPRNKATYLAFAGVKRKPEMWTAGHYEGRVEIVRDGAVAASASAPLEIAGDEKR